MKEKNRLRLGIGALVAGILTAQAIGYFAAKNAYSYNKTTDIIETEKMLNLSEERLENLCQNCRLNSRDLEKQGFLKNFYNGDYGMQKAFEDYVKKHCKK